MTSCSLRAPGVLPAPCLRPSVRCRAALRGATATAGAVARRRGGGGTPSLKLGRGYATSVARNDGNAQSASVASAARSSACSQRAAHDSRRVTPEHGEPNGCDADSKHRRGGGKQQRMTRACSDMGRMLDWAWPSSNAEAGRGAHSPSSVPSSSPSRAPVRARAESSRRATVPTPTPARETCEALLIGMEQRSQAALTEGAAADVLGLLVEGWVGAKARTVAASARALECQHAARARRPRSPCPRLQACARITGHASPSPRAASESCDCCSSCGGANSQPLR